MCRTRVISCCCVEWMELPHCFRYNIETKRNRRSFGVELFCSKKMVFTHKRIFFVRKSDLIALCWAKKVWAGLNSGLKQQYGREHSQAYAVGSTFAQTIASTQKCKSSSVAIFREKPSEIYSHMCLLQSRSNEFWKIVCILYSSVFNETETEIYLYIPMYWGSLHAEMTEWRAGLEKYRRACLPTYVTLPFPTQKCWKRVKIA
jgi:hypothetical protein